MDAHELPDQIRTSATSVKIETGKRFTREPILAEILNETDRWYKILQSGREQQITDEWRRLTSTLGRKVLVTTGQETCAGFAEGIDERGLLLIRLPSGKMKRISSGDLTALN